MAEDQSRITLESDQSTIMETANTILESWKRAVEAKDWSGLADLIGLPEIMISGRPRPIAEIIRTLSQETENLFDFEINFSNVKPRVLTDDRASLDFEAQVLWAKTDTFEEQCLEVIGYASFIHSRDAWRSASLYLDSTRQAEAAAPPTPAPAAQAPLSDEAIAQAAATYFERAARPEGAPAAPQPERPPAESAIRRRKLVVYVPIIIDDDVARDLLS